MEVAPGVHRLTNGVSNFYLVEDAGKLLLVDAGASGDWDLFAQAVAALNRTPADLEAVLLMHAHSDHTGFARDQSPSPEVSLPPGGPGSSASSTLGVQDRR